jgi:hypothetical protein
MNDIQGKVKKGKVFTDIRWSIADFVAKHINKKFGCKRLSINSILLVYPKSK